MVCSHLNHVIFGVLLGLICSFAQAAKLHLRVISEILERKDVIVGCLTAAYKRAMYIYTHTCRFDIYIYIYKRA
jgi:hypothetical protein